jgi:hypothetical protein
LCIINISVPGFFTYCAEYVQFTESQCTQGMGMYNAQCATDYVGYCESPGLNPRRTYFYGTALTQQAVQTVCPGGKYVPRTGPGGGGAGGSSDGGAGRPDLGGTGGANGVGADGGNGTGRDGGSAACTTLTIGGDVVTPTAGVGAPPTPAGGTIASGTYRLSKVEVFSPGLLSSFLQSLRATVRISGSQWEEVDEYNGGSTTTHNTSFSTMGTTYTETHTCPDTTVDQARYTATATTLLFFVELTTPNGTPFILASYYSKVGP